MTTTDTRARAILAAGAVTETNRQGVYRVQSSNGKTSYLCSPSGRWCYCPARVTDCKHLEACRHYIADKVRAEAARRGVRVLAGPSQAQPVGADVEPGEYEAPGCGLDECDCADYAS